ncbi:MAG: hypothetical protein WB347_22820 [Terriglobales bacterium]
MYPSLVLVITLLMLAAPVTALANCGEEHFRCCGMSPAKTGMTVVSCVATNPCYDTRAERQDGPDVQAISAVAQRARAEAPVVRAVPDPPFFAEFPLQLPDAETQPLLCTFLI